MKSSKKLWEHSQFQAKTDKEGFEGGLEVWYKKCPGFLNERKADINGIEQVCALQAQKCLISLKTNPFRGCLSGMTIWN